MIPHWSRNRRKLKSPKSNLTEQIGRVFNRTSGYEQAIQRLRSIVPEGARRTASAPFRAPPQRTLRARARSFERPQFIDCSARAPKLQFTSPDHELVE